MSAGCAGRVSAGKWDVVIVGAGPAGLFAALTLVLTTRLRVLVADAGADVENRLRDGDPASARDDLVRGVGGAGLFSDGKLCLSLDVGGNLGSARPPAELERLLGLVEVAFGIDPDQRPDSGEGTDVATEARRLGLTFSYYPVVHVGTDYCASHVRELRNVVRGLGGHIAPRYELTQLELGPGDRFDAVFDTPRGYRAVTADAVVLAMGKTGSDFQSRLCQRLGASSETLPMYVGVRLESSNANLAPLFDGALDPKYKMHFADGTKIKTHCAGRDGFVLPVRYESLPIAGGHAYRTRKSGRSSFGVLWDGVRGHPRPYAYARELMRRCAELTNGQLLAQRLTDYLNGHASQPDAIAQACPSTDEWAAGDVTNVLPSGLFPQFDAFMSKLEVLAPGLLSEETVLFAPAIEWWMRRIETDDASETAVPGLYVAGDGAGWSQGIVHAAASGIVVGEAISGAALPRKAICRARARTTRALFDAALRQPQASGFYRAASG